MTSWGTVKFRDDPNAGVSGKYPVDEGRIIGSLQGSALEGYWVESDAKQKCDRARDQSFYWGRIKLVFNDELSAFSGNWSRCNEPLDSAKTWIGARSTGRPAAGSRAILIPEAGHDLLPEFQEATKNFLRECCQ